MATKFRIPWWLVALVVLVGALALLTTSVAPGVSGCPGSQVYCPGVGCVSGQEKCFPGAKGGASAVFSELFSNWPGSGVRSAPPVYGKEGFTMKSTCPDGTRTKDGQCLMDF